MRANAHVLEWRNSIPGYLIGESPIPWALSIPLDRSSRVPLVMATDLLVDRLRDGCVQQLARAVKSSKDLDDRRVLERLEIERQFWRELGVDWGIVTELDIPEIPARNIDWIRGHGLTWERGMCPGVFAQFLLPHDDDFHRSRPGIVGADQPRCGLRQIQGAAWRERAAIIHADVHRATIARVGDPQPCAEGQGAVGGGQRTDLEDFAAGGWTSLVARAIP